MRLGSARGHAFELSEWTSVWAQAGFQVMTEKVRGIADGICRQYMEKEREASPSKQPARQDWCTSVHGTRKHATRCGSKASE
eukprot:179595-Amphidinium_carterae.1